MPFPSSPDVLSVLHGSTMVHSTTIVLDFPLLQSEASRIQKQQQSTEGEKSMFESWLCDLGSSHLSFWVSVSLDEKRELNLKVVHRQTASVSPGLIENNSSWSSPKNYCKRFSRESVDAESGFRNTGLDYFECLQQMNCLHLLLFSC